jgi:hypothetical protein
MLIKRKAVRGGRTRDVPYKYRALQRNRGGNPEEKRENREDKNRGRTRGEKEEKNRGKKKNQKKETREPGRDRTWKTETEGTRENLKAGTSLSISNLA